MGAHNHNIEAIRLQGHRSYGVSCNSLYIVDTNPFAAELTSRDPKQLASLVEPGFMGNWLRKQSRSHGFSTGDPRCNT